MINVKVINYGGGNTGSLVTAFKKIDINLTVAKHEADLMTADLLVLPGVGSAKSALFSLEKDGWLPVLQARHEAQKPILGVCLGAQMMFEYLHEAQKPGLGWLHGEVRPFTAEPYFNNGWCHLEWSAFESIGLSRGLKPTDTFYFNHQFYQPVDPAARVVAIADMPGTPALFLRNHLCGIQFHPEKSQHAGALILRNLIADYYGL